VLSLVLKGKISIYPFNGERVESEILVIETRSESVAGIGIVGNSCPIQNHIMEKVKDAFKLKIFFFTIQPKYQKTKVRIVGGSHKWFQMCKMDTWIHLIVVKIFIHSLISLILS
jgi:hypothetical protein